MLTDLTGEFNRVILEFEVENIAEFEAQLKDYSTNEAFRAKMKGYTDLYISGSREIMQAEEGMFSCCSVKPAKTDPAVCGEDSLLRKSSVFIQASLAASASYCAPAA